LAVNDPLGFSDGRPLSVPVANLWFSLSFTLASVVENILLMHYPPKSAGLARPAFGCYLSENFDIAACWFCLWIGERVAILR